MVCVFRIHITGWYVGVRSLVPEKVVQTKTCENNPDNLVWIQAKSCSEHSKAIGQNSESILYNTACSGETVILDSLIGVEVSKGILFL